MDIMDINEIFNEANFSESHTNHRLSIATVAGLASDAAYHRQLIFDVESNTILKEKYGIELTTEEINIFEAYHNLLLKIHCES